MSRISTLFSRRHRRRREHTPESPETATTSDAASAAPGPEKDSRPQAATSRAGTPAASAKGEGRMTTGLLPVLVGLAAIGLALTMMKTYSSFIGPIFLALNLMITAYPAYAFMARHRIPRPLAATLAGFLIIAVLVLFLYGMYWSIESMVIKLPDYSDKFNDLYKQIVDQATRLGLDEKNIEQQIKRVDPKSVAGFAANLLSNVSAVSSMVLVMVTSLIFMMMDTPEMHERLSLARRTHGSFVDSLGAFAVGIRKYWIVTTVFGLIVAILDGAVLIGLGVPLALVWAIFSFLTNYIPNIGFVIGLIPPALFGLVDGGPKVAIAVVVAYSVLNFVVQSIIQPKFAGNAVGLTPTLSFISLLLWTAVLGPLGALLALPMSLLVKALLIDPNPQVRWVNALISSRPQDAIEPEPLIEPNYTPHAD